ncbi:MAG: VanZ family protein [Candidatus Acidiferrales bacterium]
MLDLVEANGETTTVMQSQAAQPNLQSDSEGWSNRILIAAMAGILFLTCFPFRFISHAKLPDGVSPFFLGVTFGKHTRVLDDFLNVLLFVPFGFGLSEKLFEKGKSRTTTFFLVWIGGFFLSYAIEIIQLYIPGRDSGWEDVLTNSTGAAVGFLLFIVLGSALLQFATTPERAIESVASIRWLAIVLLIYFSCWFAVSARLQAETRLTNWLPDSRLLIGSDVIGQAGMGWKGEISKLEFWDRALSPQVALALTRGAVSPADAPGALAAYDFTGSAPFRDQMKFLPDLAWSAGVQAQGDPNQLVLDGGAWLISVAPVSGLIAHLRRTNQFAIHILCKPADGNGPDSRIISIPRSPYMANLNVWQEDQSLVFWFRSPLSARHAQIAFNVPKALAPNQLRNILYSYDGADLSLYVDGKRAGFPYRLGPGAALARFVRWVRPKELDGYSDIYYGMVFFPAGVALGIFLKAGRAQGAAAWLLFALALIAAPLLLEYLLIAVSGRTFSPGNVVFAVALSAAGALWINAEGAQRMRASAPQ